MLTSSNQKKNSNILWTKKYVEKLELELAIDKLKIFQTEMREKFVSENLDELNNFRKPILGDKNLKK